ncbi:MAG: phage terminase large subunit family protein [Desulfobulbaceae bacterium]|nr:phage terminase large subunit family protein [Desulfobulbaceae bacterium]
MNELTPQNRTGGKAVRSFRGTLPAPIRELAGAVLARLCDGGVYRFSFSRPERRQMRRRRKIKPSEFAPRHIKVPTGRFAGAYMNLDMRPHLVGIMDAYALPFIRKITVAAVPQAGKTTLSVIWFAWTSFFAPGPTLTVYPNEQTGTENMQDRFQKTFEISPALRRLLTGRKEDVAKHALRLVNCWLRVGWSGSTTSAANRSIRYLNLDEVNKYTEKPDKSEASIFSLFKIRVRDFANHKVSVMSSHSDERGFINIELERETEAVFVFWVRCPYCGTEQQMDFTPDTFWWPHDETIKPDGSVSLKSVDRKEILSKSLARYVCINEACSMRLWDDDARNQAIQTRTWRLRTDDGSPGEEMFRYLYRERPASIGFVIPSWILRNVSLSEVAHDYLKSKDKTLSPEERFEAAQNFANKHRCRPWRYEIRKQPAERLKRLCDERPAGVVPGGNRVAGLFAGVDTQDDSFFISIWAFGYGTSGDQWLVLRKQVLGQDDVAKILWQDEYYDADGNRYPVLFALQDMGGHRQREVLEFCIEYEGLILPSFGSPRPMPVPYSFSQKEYAPGDYQALPGGGVRAMRVNTKWFKDFLAVRLGLELGTPGAVHLYHDCDEDFRKQLLSEVRDEKGIWQPISGRANHYWDCWVLANCAAEHYGIKNAKRPEEMEKEEDGLVVVAESSFMGGR